MLDNTPRRSLIITIISAVLCSCVAARQVDAASWHGTRQLRASLSTPVTLLWQGQQLRKSLAILEANYRIEIWLDRRLDPNQTFDLEISGQPLGEVIQGIVQQCDAGYQIYGDLIYVGPKQASDDLATLMTLAREQLNTCPARVQRRWLGRYEIEWHTPTEPLLLLQQLAAHCQADLATTQLVPHDLWQVGKAPDLRAYELATLWLLGFDRAVRIDPRTGNLTVEKLQSLAAVKRNYETNEKLQHFLKTNPPIASQRSGSRILVSGSVEYHHELVEYMQGKSPSPTSPVGTEKNPSKKPRQLAFTLRIENQPVGAVTDQLAKQLKLKVTWTAETKPLRNQLVSCQVRDATLDELLATVLAPANLKATQEEGEYRITKQ